MGVTIADAATGGVATKRALDCPKRAVPAVPLTQPRTPRDIPYVALSRGGDLFLFKEDPGPSTKLWSEVIPRGTLPPGRTFALPDTSKRGGPRGVQSQSGMVHSTSLAYCPGDVARNPRSPWRDRESVIFRFDGNTWSEEPLPAQRHAIHLMDDGTLLVVQAAAEAGESGVVLWTRREGCQTPTSWGQP